MWASPGGLDGWEWTIMAGGFCPISSGLWVNFIRTHVHVHAMRARYPYHLLVLLLSFFNMPLRHIIIISQKKKKKRGSLSS